MHNPIKEVLNSALSLLKSKRIFLQRWYWPGSIRRTTEESKYSRSGLPVRQNGCSACDICFHTYSFIEEINFYETFSGITIKNNHI